MKIFSTAYAPTSRRSGAIEPYKLAGDYAAQPKMDTPLSIFAAKAFSYTFGLSEFQGGGLRTPLQGARFWRLSALHGAKDFGGLARPPKSTLTNHHAP